MKLYRRVEVVNGETTEPVAFVGVHPVLWCSSACLAQEPTAAFVEASDVEQIIADLLAAGKALEKAGVLTEYLGDKQDAIKAMRQMREATAKAEEVKCGL